MTAVPAKVAGVPEVVLVVPPDRATGLAARRHAGRGRHRRRRRGVPRRRRPGRSARWPTAPSRSAPVDVIVGPGNVYVALAKREVAGEGRVGVPVAPSPGRPRWWWSPTRRRRPTCAAIDVIVQAEHGPDGLAWLITWDEAVADAVADAVAGLRRRVRRAGPRSRPPSADGRLRRPGRRARAGHRRRQRHRPRAPRSSWSTTPRRSCRWCATPAPSSAGRSRRPRSATTWPGPATCCPPTARPASARRLHGRRLPQARPRRHGRPRPRFAAVAPPRRRAGRGRGPRRPRRVDPPAPGRAGDRSRRRDDLALMEGYHSPQVDVAVRLNTNESPEPPPAGLARRASPPRLAARRLAPLPRPRRHRAAGGHRRAPRRRARPGLRGQRLERGAPDRCCLAYGGAGPHASPPSSRPTRCTATSPASPAPRWSEGERADDFALDLDEVRRVAGRRPSRSITFLCSPNNPTGHGRRRGRRARGARPGARPRGRRRGLRPVRAVVGARRWSTTTGRSWSPAPSPRRGRWRRPASATWSGPPWLVDRARQGRAAVPPRRGQAGRRPPGPATSPTRWRRGWRPSSRSAAGSPPRLGRAAGRRVAVGRQLRPVPARSERDGPGGVAGAARPRRCSCATARRGPASTAACASPIGTPAEDDAFLDALRGGARA